MIWLLLDLLCTFAIIYLLSHGNEENFAFRGVTVLILCGFGMFCLIKFIIAVFAWLLAL